MTGWIERIPPQLICERLAPLMTDRRRRRIEETLEKRIMNLIVLIEDLHDPHNISAVLRTCEGMGIQQVAVIEGPSTFKSHPQVSQGAHKWLHVYRFRETENAIRWLRTKGFVIYASYLGEGSEPLERCLPFPENLAIFFGNEHEGLSRMVIEEADRRFMLPMRGFTESFNVSVAAALTLCEVFHHGFKPRYLTEEERWRLRAEWYMKSVRRSPELLRDLLDRSGSPIEPSPDL